MLHAPTIRQTTLRIAFWNNLMRGLRQVSVKKAKPRALKASVEAKPQPRPARPFIADGRERPRAPPDVSFVRFSVFGTTVISASPVQSFPLFGFCPGYHPLD